MPHTEVSWGTGWARKVAHLLFMQQMKMVRSKFCEQKPPNLRWLFQCVQAPLSESRKRPGGQFDVKRQVNKIHTMFLNTSQDAHCGGKLDSNMYPRLVLQVRGKEVTKDKDTCIHTWFLKQVVSIYRHVNKFFPQRWTKGRSSRKPHKVWLGFSL